MYQGGFKMHIIETYRIKHGLTQKEFADLIKKICPNVRVSRMHIAHIENNERMPSKDLALAIEQATNGEIKAEWLLLPQKYKEEIEEYLNKEPAGVGR